MYNTDIHISQPRTMNRAFVGRLQNCYNALLESDLVKTKDPSLENLIAFRKSLNFAQPKNSEEDARRDMIYLSYGKTMDTYYNHIITENMKYMVLWLNIKHIIEHFKLNKIVYIKWNHGYYNVYKYRDASTAQSDQSPRDNTQPTRTTKNPEKSPMKLEIKTPIKTSPQAHASANTSTSPSTKTIPINQNINSKISYADKASTPPAEETSTKKDIESKVENAIKDILHIPSA